MEATRVENSMIKNFFPCLNHLLGVVSAGSKVYVFFPHKLRIFRSFLTGSFRCIEEMDFPIKKISQITFNKEEICLLFQGSTTEIHLRCRDLNFWDEEDEEASIESQEAIQQAEALKYLGFGPQSRDELQTKVISVFGLQKNGGEKEGARKLLIKLVEQRRMGKERDKDFHNKLQQSHQTVLRLQDLNICDPSQKQVDIAGVDQKLQIKKEKKANKNKNISKQLSHQSTPQSFQIACVNLKGSPLEICTKDQDHIFSLINKTEGQIYLTTPKQCKRLTWVGNNMKFQPYSPNQDCDLQNHKHISHSELTQHTKIKHKNTQTQLKGGKESLKSIQLAMKETIMNVFKQKISDELEIGSNRLISQIQQYTQSLFTTMSKKHEQILQANSIKNNQLRQKVAGEFNFKRNFGDIEKLALQNEKDLSKLSRMIKKIGFLSRGTTFKKTKTQRKQQCQIFSRISQNESIGQQKSYSSNSSKEEKSFDRKD